jgi:RHH-type transcriptional regulator, rel operon repressor / antitoxin RelB
MAGLVQPGWPLYVEHVQRKVCGARRQARQRSGRLAAVARSQGRSKSDIAREAVRRYVDLHDEAYRREARRQSLRASRRDDHAEATSWEMIEAETGGWK